MADADARLELERRKVTLTQQHLSIVYVLLHYLFLFYFEGNNAHVHRASEHHSTPCNCHRIYAFPRPKSTVTLWSTRSTCCRRTCTRWAGDVAVCADGGVILIAHCVLCSEYHRSRMTQRRFVTPSLLPCLPPSPPLPPLPPPLLFLLDFMLHSALS